MHVYIRNCNYTMAVKVCCENVDRIHVAQTGTTLSFCENSCAPSDVR
jgi:hypothetical protein